MESRHFPAMVLVDRYVRFVDELNDIIQEAGGLPPYEAMMLALSDSSIRTNQDREEAILKQVRRYRSDVEEPAFEILRERKACRAATVRKEPVAFTSYDADYLREVLDGIEPCFSHVGDAPSVTSFSLNISWPPGHPQRGHQASAFIASCDQSLLLLCVGNCRPSNRQPGFYLVYNARANSVAIVPPLLSCGVSSWSHCDIAGANVGAGVLSLKTKKRDDYYILVELLLRRSHLPTNKATLFMWKSRGPMSCQWLQREVLLPLPLPAQDQDNPFRAHMVFAVGSTSICWVDLLSGVLVYKHTAAAADTNQPLTSSFHFIPLPEGYATNCELMDDMHPEEYRSMCCDNGGKALNFVSMDGYSQKGMAEVAITLWVWYQPLNPTRGSQWQLVRSVSIRDFWHNHLYNDLSLNPSFPVISTLVPDVIYVSVCNYKYNHKDEVLEAKERYVLSLCMRSRSVVSSFKVPCEDGIVPHQRIFTSHFASYLNQTRGDLYEEFPTWKEVADEEESRNSPAVWTSLWISREDAVKPTRLVLQRDTSIPSTPCGASSTSSTKIGRPAFFPQVVGLHSAMAMD